MFEIDDNLDLYANVKVAYSGNISDYVGNESFEGVDFISVDGKSNDEINEVLKGADMVFIIAGAQTSSVAEAAKEIGALTIAFVDEEIESKAIDTFFVISDSDKAIIPRIIKAIADLIAVPGLVNLDFADVKSILGNAGRAYAGAGEAQETANAVKAAINNVSDNISSSRSLLLNIIGATEGLSMMEVSVASMAVQEASHEDAEIIWGVSIDESLGDKIIATIIITNFAE